QPPPRAFSQFIWISQLWPPRVWLYPPLPMLPVVGPNFHAHLSAFSLPLPSYHALRSGSEIASSLSCAMMDAMPSAPLSPFGLTVWASHAFGQRSGLPTNEYLMSAPEMVALVCQPQ